MSSFAGQSYLTVRSSLCIILIWDACIFNLYNICQTGSSYLRRKPHQCALRFNEKIPRTHFLQLQPSIRPVPAQVILLWKGRPKLCIECYRVPLWAFPPKSPGCSKLKAQECNGQFYSKWSLVCLGTYYQDCLQSSFLLVSKSIKLKIIS